MTYLISIYILACLLIGTYCMVNKLFDAVIWLAAQHNKRKAK